MHSLYKKIDWETMEKEKQNWQKMWSGRTTDDRCVTITELRHRSGEREAVQICVDGVSVFEVPPFTYASPNLEEIKTFLEFWEPGTAPC